MDKEIQQFYDGLNLLSTLILGGTSPVVILFIGVLFSVLALISIGLVISLSLFSHGEEDITKFERQQRVICTIVALISVPISIFVITTPVNSYDLRQTQKEIQNYLLDKVINNEDKEMKVIEIGITPNYKDKNIYLLDFSLGGKQYEDKIVLVVEAKQVDSKRLGLIEVDLSIFSETEKDFLEQVYNRFPSKETFNKPLTNIEYIYVVPPSQKEG